jgi:flagellar M-ring protein FliF
MQIIIQFFKEMSPAKLAATIIMILIFLLLFIVYLTKINSSEYVVLYSGLEIQDSAKVAQELENQKIDFQASADGSVIKVHKSKVIKTRLSLAQSGLPNSGSVIGYEIFDEKDAIGSTNFSQNIKFVRALEGELSRTITAFEQIEKARVHLVMPQREIFSKEKTEPRASVVLKFRGTKKLGKAEIDAISHLVVTAVPNLEMKNVTIIDTHGRALKIGSSEEESDFAGGRNEELKISGEERLRQIIEDLLSNTLGAGKVKARVSLEMNFDREVINSELFDPDSAVVRSVQSIDENEQIPVAGADGSDASVANNIPGGAGGGGDQSTKFSIINKSDSTTNYEISKTVKNHITESGKITKMSIGILVDGIYKINDSTKEKEYSERSKEELEKISNLVKVAVGFDESRDDKIEVVNMKFSDELIPIEESNFEWIKEELPGLFQTLIVAIVVSLVLITVIRPVALKAFEIKKYGEDGQSLLPDIDVTMMSNQSINIPASISPVAAVAGGVTEPVKSVDNPIQKINELVESSPNDVASTLRKWLDEDS